MGQHPTPQTVRFPFSRPARPEPARAGTAPAAFWAHGPHPGQTDGPLGKRCWRWMGLPAFRQTQEALLRHVDAAGAWLFLGAGSVIAQKEVLYGKHLLSV